MSCTSTEKWIWSFLLAVIKGGRTFGLFQHSSAVCVHLKRLPGVWTSWTHALCSNVGQWLHVDERGQGAKITKGCDRSRPTALSFLSFIMEDKPHDWLFFNMQVRFKKRKKKETVKHMLSTCIICVPVVYKYVYCNWWLIIMYIKIRPRWWLVAFLSWRVLIFVSLVSLVFFGLLVMIRHWITHDAFSVHV